MRAEEFKEALRSRAISSLYNEEEITTLALDTAVEETFSECSGKDVKEWAMMDFAMARLKLYLKIGLSELEFELFKQAKKEIQNSAKLGESKSFIDEFSYKVI